MREYAAYKGDDLLVVGTAKEVAQFLGIVPSSVRWYTTPTAEKRLKKRKKPEKCLSIIKLPKET